MNIKMSRRGFLSRALATVAGGVGGGFAGSKAYNAFIEGTERKVRERPDFSNVSDEQISDIVDEKFNAAKPWVIGGGALLGAGGTNVALNLAKSNTMTRRFFFGKQGSDGPAPGG